MEVRFHGFATFAKRGGDLVNRHFLDISEKHDLAIVFGQLLNRAS